MRRTASHAGGGAEEDNVDAREVDKVLTEVSSMAGRWSLFRKFLYERLKVSPLKGLQYEELIVFVGRVGHGHRRPG